MLDRINHVLSVNLYAFSFETMLKIEIYYLGKTIFTALLLLRLYDAFMPPIFKADNFELEPGQSFPDHIDKYPDIAIAPASGKWALTEMDSSSYEDYTLAIAIEDEDTAILLANARLKSLNKSQPNSGGQSLYGLQDRVFIVDPAKMSTLYNPEKYTKRWVALEQNSPLEISLRNYGWRIPGAQLAVAASYTEQLPNTILPDYKGPTSQTTVMEAIQPLIGQLAASTLAYNYFKNSLGLGPQHRAEEKLQNELKGAADILTYLAPLKPITQQRLLADLSQNFKYTDEDHHEWHEDSIDWQSCIKAYGYIVGYTALEIISKDRSKYRW